MKNSSQTQHHRSETKRKEEQKIEEIRKKKDAGCRLEAGTNGIVMNSEAKIRYVGIFAIIAKITVHSENFNFRYACIFRYDSEFSLS